MKFTKEFIEVLKNFSIINSQMNFVDGDTQTILSASGSVFASYKSDLIMPQAFAIISLQKLLSILSLYNDPEIIISDKFLEISSSNDKKLCSYQLTNPEFIKYEKKPDRLYKIPIDIEFDLSFADYSGISKLANILKSEFLIFRGDGSKVYLEIVNSNDNGDSGSVEISDTTEVFKAVINKDLINLMENDYKVGLSNKGCIKLQADNISYFIAINKDKSSL